MPGSGTNVLKKRIKSFKRKLSDPRKWRDPTEKDGYGAKIHPQYSKKYRFKIIHYGNSLQKLKTGVAKELRR